MLPMMDGYSTLMNIFTYLKCTNSCNPFITGSQSPQFPRLKMDTEFTSNNLILCSIQIIMIILLTVISLIHRYQKYSLNKEKEMLEKIDEVSC